MGGHVCLPHTVPSHTWLLGTSGLEGTHKTPANHPPLHLVERLWGEPPARIPSPRPVPGLPPPRSNVLRAGWWPGTGGGGGAVVTAQCLPCLLPAGKPCPPRSRRDHVKPCRQEAKEVVPEMPARAPSAGGRTHRGPLTISMFSWVRNFNLFSIRRKVWDRLSFFRVRRLFFSSSGLY